MARNVLIVEDESIVAMELEHQLAKLGCSVLGPAATAQAAVKICEDGVPDLVLMDIRIQGGKDGVETAQVLRQRYNIPVIFLTALADEITMRRAKLAAPASYLLKPVREDELKAAVELAFHKRETERVLERQRAEFAAMLTHDVQSPLQVVAGCADLLSLELKSNKSPRVAELLNRMVGSLSYTVKLVADYLTLINFDSARQEINAAEHSLNDTLRRVKERYEAEATRRGLVLDADLAEDLPAVLTDGLMLERIFTNLVFNALKFTPRGGRVILSSSARGDRVVASVSDSGAGIAPEELEKIFDKGWQGSTRAAGEGTGLGLYIVKILVDALDGRIDVDSKVGRGTRFVVTFPVAATKSEM